MYPIFKLINLYFLSNNQYIALYFYSHIFYFFLLVSPQGELVITILVTTHKLWGHLMSNSFSHVQFELA
jgi:hypothetical protein